MKANGREPKNEIYENRAIIMLLLCVYVHATLTNIQQTEEVIHKLKHYQFYDTIFLILRLSFMILEIRQISGESIIENCQYGNEHRLNDGWHEMDIRVNWI